MEGRGKLDARRRVVSFHSIFGKHTADTKGSHWERGRFVSRCTSCGADMIKQPGLDWQLRKAGTS